jgi:hypothetical protein
MILSQMKRYIYGMTFNNLLLPPGWWKPTIHCAGLASGPFKLLFVTVNDATPAQIIGGYF